MQVDRWVPLEGGHRRSDGSRLCAFVALLVGAIGGWSLCLIVPPPPSPPRLDLFWIKFPKAGSPFAATVVGFACNSHTNVTTTGGIEVPKGCDRKRVGYVLAPSQTSIPRWFEAPVLWSGIRPLHRVVALFRDPRDRRESEFLYFRRMFWSGYIHCCGGFFPPYLTGKVIAILQSDLSAVDQFAEYVNFTAAYQGCMANMLLGRNCFAGTPSAQSVRRAKRMVLWEMAFVGLQHRWNDSVRLWHLKFGGAVFQNEMVHHATHDRLNVGYSDVDAEVFSAATTRFEDEFASYA